MKKINEDKLLKIIEETVNAAGISGYEYDVAKIIIKELKSNVDKIDFCGNGSVITTIGKKTKDNLNILLDTHMDEIGLMVSQILDNGFIRFVPIGGWWAHVLLAKRFNIQTRSGKVIKGIIGSTPVHILPVEQRPKVVEIKKMYLDIGAANKAEVLKWGVQIGDPIYKDSTFFQMTNPKFLCGKSFDNRISSALLVYIMKNLKELKQSNVVNGVFSSQEEVGCRGAKTAAFKVNPDIAIVIDTTLSHDQVGMSHNDVNLGKGAVLEILDAAIITNKKFRHFVDDLAKEHGIPIHYACLADGGTNGGPVHLTRGGVITIVLSVPIRYMHTPNEICHIDDVVNTIKLINLILENLTKEKFVEFKNFYK